MHNLLAPLHQAHPPHQALASAEALSALPTPEHINLLLKKGKHTVLLSALPSTTFLDLASLLLTALKSRALTSIDGATVPDDAEDVEFAVLKNKRDPEAGWVPAEAAEVEDKGGKRKGPGKKNAGGAVESLKDAGLVDGSLIAFRFRRGRDEEGEATAEHDLGWNVVLPSYEDELE